MEEAKETVNLLEQLDNLTRRMIEWSEWEGGVLRAEYLTLHESKIGVHEEYRMGKYLVAFLNFVLPLNCGLNKVGFFYSFEEGATPVPPGQCKREQYYAYEYTLPESSSECKKWLIDFRGRIPQPDIKKLFDGDESLLTQLNDYHYIQPYMLLFKDGKPHHSSNIVSVCDNNVEKLLDDFRRDGYQFSIYAYKFANSTKLDDPVLKCLFRLAFIVHILTWNHDLKTAHLVLTGLHSTISEVERIRRGLDGTLGQLSDQLRHAFQPRDQVPTLPCRPVDADVHGWHTEFPATGDLKLHGLPALRDAGTEWRSHVCSERRLHQYAQFVNSLAPGAGAADLNAAGVAAWLLSREIDRSEPWRFGLWPDQVCLALLRGLNFDFHRAIPIKVTYRVEKNATTRYAAAAGDLHKTLFSFKAPARPTRSSWWKDTASPSVVLKFVNAGWVRLNEDVGHVPYMCMAHWRSSLCLKRFLDALSIFAKLVAAHPTSSEPGWVQLKRVLVEFTLQARNPVPTDVTIENGWGTSEMNIIFRCTDEPRLDSWSTSGTWPTRVRALASACGQSTVRVFNGSLAEGFYATPKLNGHSDWVIRMTGTGISSEESPGDDE